MKKSIAKVLVLMIALTMMLAVVPVGAVDAEAYGQDYATYNDAPPPEQ